MARLFYVKKQKHLKNQNNNVKNWESGERKPPSYVLNLLEKVVEQDREK